MIKTSLKFFAVCFAVVLITSAAQAFTITYTLLINDAGPATFSLFASTDAPGGISGYGVDLNDALTMDHNSPVAAFSGVTGTPAGFNLGRNADNGSFVRGAQETSHALWPAQAIYSFGIAASDFGSEGLLPVFGIVEGDFWGVPLLLAVGTHNDPTTFDEGGPNAGGNVFAVQGDTGNPQTADLVYVTTVIPEPATLMLAGFSLIGIFTGRRRV